MKTLTIQLPDDLDYDDLRITRFLAAKLYENGELSMGKAAEMAGVPYREFMQNLKDYRVFVFNYPAEELDRDIETARRFARNASRNS